MYKLTLYFEYFLYETQVIDQLGNTWGTFLKLRMHYSPTDVKLYLKSPLDLKDAKLQCVIVQDEILAFLTE